VARLGLIEADFEIGKRCKFLIYLQRNYIDAVSEAEGRTPRVASGALIRSIPTEQFKRGEPADLRGLR
jgi:hypothetical protein